MQTIFFENKPRIIATATIAGPKECAGVVGDFVDKALTDDMFGETTYEKAECKMLSYAISQAIKNANAEEGDVDMLISGDLLNQIISASFRFNFNSNCSCINIPQISNRQRHNHISLRCHLSFLCYVNFTY